MDMDKELVEVMAANTEWKGSPDQMWQRVEDEIRRRRRRKWQVPAWGVAAAAVLIAVVGTRMLSPGETLDTNPPPVASGEQVEQPPVFAPPSTGATNARAFTPYNTLPGFIAYHKTIFVGQVTDEKEIEIPPTEDQWQTYQASLTPPPPDHPKAKSWTPPEPPKPTPAKLFTIKVTDGIKGIASGETVTVQQLNVTYANAGPEPVLRVGEKYMLFPRKSAAGLYQVGAPYVALGDDNRLHVVSLPISFERSAEGPGYLRELHGADIGEGMTKLRFAVRAETAIGAALAKVGLHGVEGEAVSAAGVPFDVANFPRFVGSQPGCVSVGTSGRVIASYESSVWPKSGGVNEVKMTRRVKLEGNDHETTWTFQVNPNGSVDGPVRTGTDLEVSRCAPVR